MLSREQEAIWEQLDDPKQARVLLTRRKKPE